MIYMAKKQKVRGTNVTVSPKAHEMMLTKAFKSKPRLTLREYQNIIHGLPKDL